MATKIITKNSSTTTAIPTAGDLVQGELAVNVTDKRLFTEDSGGAIVELGTNPSTLTSGAATFSGNVGIGTSAPSGAYTQPKLHIHATGNGAELHLTDGTTGAAATDGLSIFQYGVDSYIHAREATGSLRTFVAGAERMRLDASGNLLVGTTSNSSSVTGVTVGNSGLITACRSAIYSGIFNRLSTDGDIVQFRKNGTTVGSIGASGGDLYLGNAATGLYFNDSSAAIHSYNTTTLSGGSTDGTVDLGASGVRFKDLYLSGTVNAGAATFSGNVSSAGGMFCDTQAQFGRTSLITAVFGDASTVGNKYIRMSHAGAYRTDIPSINAVDAGIGGTSLYIQSGGSDTLVGGNLLVGTTSDTAKLSVYEAANNTEANPHFRITGAGYSGYHWLNATAYYIGQNSGARNLRLYSGAETAGVNLANAATSWGTFSDERLKYDIEPIENALESLSNLRTVKYRLIDVDSADSQKKLGLIAQDLVGVLDEIIDPLKRSDDETEYMSVRYTEMVPVLVKAIQEQQVIIEALTARLEALEGA
ncbi:tail fiber domain-containing protein [Pseudomonadales bacterium]|nr:tail fiber domain-containing protein [Pseudomonadales bacterium]